METKQSSVSFVKEIKRRTRRVFSSEEKIKIVVEGLRGEDSIAACAGDDSVPEDDGEVLSVREYSTNG